MQRLCHAPAACGLCGMLHPDTVVIFYCHNCTKKALSHTTNVEVHAITCACQQEEEKEKGKQRGGTLLILFYFTVLILLFVLLLCTTSGKGTLLLVDSSDCSSLDKLLCRETANGLDSQQTTTTKENGELKISFFSLFFHLSSPS